MAELLVTTKTATATTAKTHGTTEILVAAGNAAMLQETQEAYTNVNLRHAYKEDIFHETSKALSNSEFSNRRTTHSSTRFERDEQTEQHTRIKEDTSGATNFLYRPNTGLSTPTTTTATEQL